MVLWVVREQEQRMGPGEMEHMRDGGSPPAQLTLGTYTTLALAREAVAMRVRNLFGGGDCFTAPCPAGLYMTQSWADDGTGEMLLEEVKQYDDTSVLTLSIETQQVDLPPPLDRRPYCWHKLEDAAGYVRPAPPPPTAEELEQLAVQEAALAASRAGMVVFEFCQC